ncbi:hypothetical protein GQX73_g5580 [Xylaria multiplex]|uniref:Uncharacterized protein n=1 Tax=Xylaria multiplex TaxID=323545 RepID=A0A7C8MPA3_9PEZI|nr:hypothetical protein GQX73_g5580 [Xylaria multiplex]
MSQKGGTYQPSSKTVRDVQSELSPQSLVQKPINFDGKGHHLDKSDVGESHPASIRHGESSRKAKCERTQDIQEWELVSIHDESKDDTDAPANRIESHFDFTVGWGRRKLTLLSWDVKYEIQKNGKGAAD